MVWGLARDGRARLDDTTRDRTVLMNQLLLAGVTLLAAVLAVVIGQVRHPEEFAIGLALVFLGAGAAILVPWRRLRPAASGLLPVIDIVAVALLRDAAPTAGLGLLWAFPAMWISATFGVAGVIGVTVAVSALLGMLVSQDPEQSLSASTILLPITIAALAWLAHLTARRAQAQRVLLDKQSEHLRHSVERARRQEDLVTEVLDAVDFGVIRIDADGALAVTNEAHGKLQGTFASDRERVAYAADGSTLLDPADAPIQRARRGDVYENELVWYGAPGGARRALSVTARAVTNPNGEPDGAIVVSRDVTVEEQVLRAREDLIASVSHELRTPLTSILGYLELAMDRPDLPPPARTELEIAERNASRLLELVADILAAPSMTPQGGDLRLDLAMVDAGDLARAAVADATARAAQRRITIDASAVETVVVHADPRRLRQVLDNLLTNAEKYNDDGGHVSVSVSSDGVHVWLTVRDDGPGIPEDEQPRVFERFFRADAVRNSTIHGSGLGLSISRDIVRSHGGEMFLQSRPGQGAAFTVRLPAPAPEESS